MTFEKRHGFCIINSMKNRVLLIDDEDQFRNSVKIALKRRDVEVVEEKDGFDGLKNIIFSKTTGSFYDLIIVDIMMPRVSGIDILEFLVQKRIDVPVIVVTGFMDYDLKFFCSRIKRISVLEKPFHQNVLVDEVLKMLQPAVDGEIL